jgi:hypothetical protein
MRASDLLGHTVHDAEGGEAIVIGLLAIQDRPLGEADALRVSAVVVSSRHTGAYLGYQQDSQRGPWLLAALIQVLHRHARAVPWTAVSSQLLNDGRPGSS